MNTQHNQRQIQIQINNEQWETSKESDRKADLRWLPSLESGENWLARIVGEEKKRADLCGFEVFLLFLFSFLFLYLTDSDAHESLLNRSHQGEGVESE